MTRLGSRIRFAVPSLLLLVFLAQKLAFDPDPVGRNRQDAVFYYQVAEHVAAGEGLRTSVSLYNMGLRHLPAPTNIYPLWPLLLGWSGRWLGLERAAWLVPEILFFVDLVLLWALANRVGRALGGEVLLRLRARPVLDVGSAVATLFGANAVFFAYTSTPWTEGLAFALLFGSLLALAPAVTGPPLRWAALAGALAGLAYLTRSQFLATPVALALALAWVGLGAPRYGRAALAALAAAVLVTLPWLAYLAASLDHVTPRMLIDFTAYRETPELAPFGGFVEAAGVGGRLADAARGLAHAFHPTAPETYLESFGVAAWLAPLAVGVAAWRRRGAGGWIPTPGALVPLATVLLALAALAPAHALHGRYPYEWFFHWRHGLPLILVIAAAAAYLGGRGVAGRAVVLALLAGSLLFPRQTAQRFAMRKTMPFAAERELILWLDSRPAPPVLLSTRVRELVLWSRATGHWTRCYLGPEQTRQQLRHLPIDYLVVYEREWNCPFVEGLAGELELVRRFGKGERRIDVLRWRGEAGAPAARPDG